jgi:rhodanese-related sulfurtransferase
MRSLVLLALTACGAAEPTKATEAAATPPAAEAAAQAGGSAEAAPATEGAATEGAPTAGKREDIDIPTFAKDVETGGITLIDVRTKGEYDSGHVKGAVLVPVDEVSGTHPAIEHLPKDKPVYVICQVGGRSSQAADKLVAAGYWVKNVKGGTGAWIATGHPVE